MSFYSVLVFTHIAAAFFLFGGLLLEWVIISFLRRNPEPAAFRAWGRIFSLAPRLYGPALGILLLSGGYLGAQMSAWAQGWIRVSFVTLFVIGAIGGLTSSRLGIIRTLLGEATDSSTTWPASLISRPAVKIAPGSAPRLLILLLVQLVASTIPLLMKESPAISPAELISNAALEDPPDRVPRFVIAPDADHCTATKLVAGLPLTLEYPTTTPALLMPMAPLIVAPESVPRSFMPPDFVHINACWPATVPVQG